MKKIAILSMHRVVNYGSFLQAYALKKMIQNSVKESVEVSFLDIEPGISLYKNNRLKRCLKIAKYFFTGKFFTKINEKKFNSILSGQFSKKFYSLLGQIDSPSAYNEYDCVVIGSDEVFHCCQNTKWGFTTQLYGDISNAKKVVSYAASFGATKIEDIYSFNLQNEISDSLKKLSAISVRDQNSNEIVKKLIDVDSEIHLDPVLIYGYKDELDLYPEFDSNEKFLLVYSYNGRINSKSEVNEILLFAKRQNLKIYTVFCDYKWADKAILPNTPFEVLKVFQKAEYVVSDTFHGTIFSIITHRKFCTLVRDSAKNKISSLLAKLGLSEHIVNGFIEDAITMNIDYSEVEEILNKEREKSAEYLMGAVVC